METFKIGDKIACYVEHGGYSEYWEAPETIVRETKSCWVTDQGTQVRKDNHAPRGFNEQYCYRTFHLWTAEMEIKKQRTLLKKSLEAEIIEALKNHKYSIEQLQYIKGMLEG